MAAVFLSKAPRQSIRSVWPSGQTAAFLSRFSGSRSTACSLKPATKDAGSGCVISQQLTGRPMRRRLHEKNRSEWPFRQLKLVFFTAKYYLGDLLADGKPGQYSNGERSAETK